MKEPTIDNTPGDGYDDTIDAALAEDREALRSIDKDDPYQEQLAPEGAALLNASEDARRFIWAARDKHRARMRSAGAMLRASSDDAARGVQTSNLDWRSGQASQAGARREVQKRAETAFATEIAGAMSDAAAGIGKAFGDAFVALADAFDSAYSDWSGPAALSSAKKLSLDDLHRQVSIESELRTANSPMAEIIRTWQSVQKSGDSDKIDLFIRAARSLALEVTQTPPPRLALRLQGGRDNVDDERAQAFRFLDMLGTYRINTRPPSLKIAGNLLGTARQNALVIFGSYPPCVVASEYAIRGTPPNSRDLDAAKKPWDLENAWFKRYLPPSPNAPALPGWSPIVSKTSGGAIFRAAKGG